MQYWLTLYGALIALYKRLHARDCGFLSKFVTVDGKYRKCQKNIHFCLRPDSEAVAEGLGRHIWAPTCYFMNPISGNPGPISRESGNGKIVGIPGNREREIPGMKHYLWGNQNYSCLFPLALSESSSLLSAPCQRKINIIQKSRSPCLINRDSAILYILQLRLLPRSG
jgi:hypothetical protein